jgi:hypothetical protein
MRRNVPRDPWALDPAGAAWHQHHTFATEPRTFAERLSASCWFSGGPRHTWGTADWVLAAEDEDPSPFPLGRVTVHPAGILLEAFSEERLSALARRANELGGGRLTADETRTFRLEHVLARPSALLDPLSELSGRAPDARAVARAYLAMAWPFFPREDLDGRAPFRLSATARGRTILARVIPKLPGELAAIPGFPRFTTRSLRALLLPGTLGGVLPAPIVPPARAPKEA